MKTENAFIIRPESIEQENALKAFAKALKMKIEVTREKPYDPEFVAKIQESKQQVKEGKVTRVKKENMKAFLGL
jgi:predicted small secreted protein